MKIAAAGLYAALICGTLIGAAQAQDDRIQKLLPSAKAGDVKAMCALGKAYDVSLQFGAQASGYDWESKAALAGVRDCYVAVGWHYGAGWGVIASQKQRLDWYAKAVLAGDAEAATEVSRVYEQAAGVPKNLIKAVAYQELAVKMESRPDIRVMYQSRLNEILDAAGKAEPPFKVPPPASRNSPELRAFAKDAMIESVNLDAGMFK